MLDTLQVRAVMTAPVETVTPTATLVEVAQRLHENDVGAAVVVREGAPVGIVTESDFAALVARGEDPAALSVEDVMVTDLVTVDPDAPVVEAVELFRTRNVKKLPVVEDGQLVGIVTTTDLSDYVPHVVHSTRALEERESRRFERPETAYEDEEWSFESYGTADGIDVGDHVEFAKTISESDVRTFAEASGDTNRLHLDSAFAKETRFGRRIVHGTLVAGTISAALARLPGLTIYLSQEVGYRGPVDLGERVTATCEVVEKLAENRFRLTTVVEDEAGETVVDGQAVVLSDPIPESARSPE